MTTDEHDLHHHDSQHDLHHNLHESGSGDAQPAGGGSYVPDWSRGATQVAGFAPAASARPVAPRRHRRTPTELAEAVRAGERGAIAQAITLVESNHPRHHDEARELIRLLRPFAGNSVRVGITGVPGAGKSTFIDALGVKLIEQGHQVAVLAVDPSSSRTGGSILGDRTRMAALTASERAFVRPSPSGGQLGGVARATRESMIVVEAAGFDVVLVETVGVGQSEVTVAGMVDTFLLITLARAGDSLQGIKRGILELADVITVNKADGDHEGEARVAARELRTAMKLITSDPDAPRPPVLTSSSYTGKGLMEVWDAVLAHRASLETSGGLAERRNQQQLEWLGALVEEDLLGAVRRSPGVRAIRDDVRAKVAAGTMSAIEGSELLVRAFVRDVPHLWPDA